jgi:hypothetical protein
MIAEYTDKLSCYFEMSHSDSTFTMSCCEMKHKKEEV